MCTRAYGGGRKLSMKNVQKSWKVQIVNLGQERSVWMIPKACTHEITYLRCFLRFSLGILFLIS